MEMQQQQQHTKKECLFKDTMDHVDVIIEHLFNNIIYAMEQSNMDWFCAVISVELDL